MEVPALLSNWLVHGPLVVLVDGGHPRHQGLPAAAHAHVLKVDLADATDRVRLDDPTHLIVEYQDEEVTRIARLAWAAVFFVAGRAEPDKVRRLLLHDRLPACFEPDRAANVNRLLNQMGLGVGRPGAPEWNLRVTPQTLSNDGDRDDWCPDRREAVETLLARDGGKAIVLVDRTSSGLQVPELPQLSGQAEFMVGRAMPGFQVDTEGESLAWSQPGPGARLEFRLPWHAVGAVQDPESGRGWWWPAELPVPFRKPLEDMEELWPVLRRLDGIPLAPPAPMPRENVSVLSLLAPMPTDRATAVQRLARMGVAVVLADAHHPDLRLGDTLPGRARVLMVPLNLPGSPSELQIDDDGFWTRMPDHDGRPVRVYVPWTAVFLAAPADGSRTGVWPDAYPEAVRTALHALRSVQRSDGGALPVELDVFDREPTGDGLGLSLERAPDGSFAIVVSQPVGHLPPPPGAPPGVSGRALLELAFRLPAPDLQ